ncbi:unnamed protein product [Dibothriocephalus latus]|uniref:Reverse transcriptase domain-containing protein n=1 Tax=Dibothriocephalus latus TaxID=60516 RepID=A0A3P6TQ81_DIBLA|nr:unnamed protein product [Dibothriocephalus latus]
MERIIERTTMKFLEEKDLFDGSQHGFRGAHSCLTNMLYSVELWSGLLDENTNADVVYIDFKKAFGGVPHQRLLYKVGI